MIANADPDAGYSTDFEKHIVSTSCQASPVGGGRRRMYAVRGLN
jgi:hypothetical protein